MPVSRVLVEDKADTLFRSRSNVTRKSVPKDNRDFGVDVEAENYAFSLVGEQSTTCSEWGSKLAKVWKCKECECLCLVGNFAFSKTFKTTFKKSLKDEFFIYTTLNNESIFYQKHMLEHTGNFKSRMQKREQNRKEPYVRRSSQYVGPSMQETDYLEQHSPNSDLSPLSDLSDSSPASMQSYTIQIPPRHMLPEITAINGPCIYFDNLINFPDESIPSSFPEAFSLFPLDEFDADFVCDCTPDMDEIKRFEREQAMAAEKPKTENSPVKSQPSWLGSFTVALTSWITWSFSLVVPSGFINGIRNYFSL